MNQKQTTKLHLKKKHLLFLNAKIKPSKLLANMFMRKGDFKFFYLKLNCFYLNFLRYYKYHSNLIIYYNFNINYYPKTQIILLSLVNNFENFLNNIMYTTYLHYTTPLFNNPLNSELTTISNLFLPYFSFNDLQKQVKFLSLNEFFQTFNLLYIFIFNYYTQLINDNINKPLLTLQNFIYLFFKKLNIYKYFTNFETLLSFNFLKIQKWNLINFYNLKLNQIILKNSIFYFFKLLMPKFLINLIEWMNLYEFTLPSFLLKKIQYFSIPIQNTFDQQLSTELKHKQHFEYKELVYSVNCFSLQKFNYNSQPFIYDDLFIDQFSKNFVYEDNNLEEIYTNLDIDEFYYTLTNIDEFYITLNFFVDWITFDDLYFFNQYLHTSVFTNKSLKIKKNLNVKKNKLNFIKLKWNFKTLKLLINTKWKALLPSKKNFHKIKLKNFKFKKFYKQNYLENKFLKNFYKKNYIFFKQWNNSLYIKYLLCRYVSKIFLIKFKAYCLYCKQFSYSNIFKFFITTLLFNKQHYFLSLIYINIKVFKNYLKLNKLKITYCKWSITTFFILNKSLHLNLVNKNFPFFKRKQINNIQKNNNLIILKKLSPYLIKYLKKSITINSKLFKSNNKNNKSFLKFKHKLFKINYFFKLNKTLIFKTFTNTNSVLNLKLVFINNVINIPDFDPINKTLLLNLKYEQTQQQNVTHTFVRGNNIIDPDYYDIEIIKKLETFEAPVVSTQFFLKSFILQLSHIPDVLQRPFNYLPQPAYALMKKFLYMKNLDIALQIQGNDWNFMFRMETFTIVKKTKRTKQIDDAWIRYVKIPKRILVLWRFLYLFMANYYIRMNSFENTLNLILHNFLIKPQLEFELYEHKLNTYRYYLLKLFI